MKIFFNSSMPRSGSTLMQNILGNNPNIYATPTSAVLDMLNASKRVYTTSPTMKAQDEKDMKSAFLMYSRFALNGYFHGLTDKPYIIDKCRGWAINMPYLNSFYPNPKIICLVRDLRDILASMEKNYRKHPDKWDISLDPENPAGTTVAERVSMWMNAQSKPVGDTLNKLKEVIFRDSKIDEKICFVRFEDLCSRPEVVMKGVYGYLGLPYHEIDYKNIQQVTFEDDKFHGRYGDHKISPEIKPVQSQARELLGDNICKQLYERNKWYFEYFNYK
jgi:sulfotransferase